MIAANLAGMMSTTLCSMIDVCDSQYVRLDTILTKQWLKDLMRLYRTLYSSEQASTNKSFFLTQQLSPLIEHMRERLRVQALSANQQYSSQKVLVKFSPERLASNNDEYESAPVANKLPSLQQNTSNQSIPTVQ